MTRTKSKLPTVDLLLSGTAFSGSSNEEIKSDKDKLNVARGMQWNGRVFMWAMTLPEDIQGRIWRRREDATTKKAQSFSRRGY